MKSNSKPKPQAKTSQSEPKPAPAVIVSRAWLADQPAGRFEFVFTPKHGSCT